MCNGNATFEEPKVHFSYIYMWEMHFLGQKNVSQITKRSFFVYIYVTNAFWGDQKKSSFSQKVHFSYIYMYVRNAFFDRKDVSLHTKSSLFVYIYMLQTHFLGLKMLKK